MSNGVPAVDRRRDDLKRSLFESGTILESTLVGIVLVVDERLAWINETFARLMGYERWELTASTRTYDRNFGVELGATDYITKPFKLQDLLEAVRKRL